MGLGQVDGQIERAPGVPGDVLHRPHHAEGHAGAAAALILHRRGVVDPADIPQVEGGGGADGLGRRAASRRGPLVLVVLEALRIKPGGRRNAEPQDSLLLGQRGHRGVGHPPGLAGFVQGRPQVPEVQ
jgi:hypothetical protein